MLNTEAVHVASHYVVVGRDGSGRWSARVRAQRGGFGWRGLAPRSCPCSSGANDRAVTGLHLVTHRRPGSEPDSLDPALTFDGNAVLIGAQIYETLITFAPNDLSPRPGLADEWSVSADGKMWTFNIPPNRKFSDGTTVDAFAVAANFNRWWDPANPHHTGVFDYFSYLFGGFKGNPNCLLINVEAPDAATFRLTLKQAHSPLPIMLGSPALSIASPAAFANLGTQPVGSGPFKLAAWVAGDHIDLIANAAYHGRAPQLNALTFKFTPDEATRLNDVQTNRVQVAFDINSATPITDVNVRSMWRPALNIGYLGLNRAHGPLGNALVQQAIAHAIDKPTLIAQHYNAGDDDIPPRKWTQS